MKFGQHLKHKLGTFFTVATLLSAIVAHSVAPLPCAAETTADKTTPEIVATLSFSGTDALWNGVEKIADVMKYKELIQSVRGLMNARANVNLIAPAKGFGVVVASNDESLLAFGYLPLADPDSFDDSAVEALKSNVKQLDKKGVMNVDFFVADGVLFVSQSEQKELVSSIPFASYGVPNQSVDSPIMSLAVNSDAIPKELLEASSAILRLKIAELAQENTAYNAQSVDHALARYVDFINTLKQLQWSLKIDENANVISQFILTLNPDGDVLQKFAKSMQTPTRWNAIAETPNSIFASTESGSVFKQNSGGDVKSLRNSVHNNLLSSLDVLVDDPENYEIAKEIVGCLEEVILAELESDVHDSGSALTSDPLSFSLASTSAAPIKLKKALDLIVNRLKKTNPKLEEAIKKEKVDAFDVTSIELELDSLNVNLPRFLAGKTLTVKCGVDSEAWLLVGSLDHDYAANEFKRIAEGSKARVPQKNESYYDLSQLAVAIQRILATYDNVRSLASRSVDAFANAKEAKLVFMQEVRGNVFEMKTTIKSDVFKAIGDVLRINTMKGNGDEGEDVDDLFEEEE